mmetsp:Transcript_3326/g.5693  ORF Transcript_3326/g.5693 Transcript_3326/m.5693 type:complete len:393 (+) Transcript_3326:162-1340(+)
MQKVMRGYMARKLASNMSCSGQTCSAGEAWEVDTSRLAKKGAFGEILAVRKGELVQAMKIPLQQTLDEYIKKEFQEAVEEQLRNSMKDLSKLDAAADEAKKTFGDDSAQFQELEGSIQEKIQEMEELESESLPFEEWDEADKEEMRNEYKYMAEDSNIRSCSAAVREIEKTKSISKDMRKFSQCQDTIMKVQEERPCHEENGLYKAGGGAYTMDLMDGDLADFKAKGEQTWRDCKIADMAMEALHCFHLAGWVHADVKLENFLWKVEKGVPNGSGCPTEVRLADYGEAGKINDARQRFDEGYNVSYLPSDMFFLPDDVKQTHQVGRDIWTLGLDSDDDGKFLLHPKLDWCSFHLAFPGTPGKYFQSGQGGNCGPMGVNRNIQRLDVEPSDSI